jgi:LytS/YehU family sensor histidine kinase
MINLDEETSRLRNYLDLEKMRLPNKFEYRIDMDDSIEAEEVYIPSMIVQPFAENAIWHGITPLEGKGIVTIIFHKASASSLSIIIEDNGVGMQKSAIYSSKGQNHLRLSLELTRKRLELLGKKFNVTTSVRFSEPFPDSENPGTKVELIVPFTYSDKIT